MLKINPTSTPSLLFRWIAIPWLQTEIDHWVSFKNKTSPRASRHKLLPHGIPALIRANPSHFNAIDFKIHVPSELFDEMEVRFAPPDHPVFELVPPPFHEYVSSIYTAIGQPEVTIDTFWNVFRDLLERLREGPNEQLTEVITNYDITLNLIQCLFCWTCHLEAFRLEQPLNLGPNMNYIGGLDPVPSTSIRPAPEYADFTTDEDEDESEEDELD